jgi:hypothetical protein
MLRTRQAALARLCLITTLALSLVANFGGESASAATAPGVQITNTASATYQDGSGNSFTSNSNTVSTTVQNAPSLTDVPGAAQNSAPGDIVVDTYTLTNTGNAAGTWTVPSDASITGSATLQGYVLGGAASGTCSVATPCTLTTLQTQLNALAATAVNGTITIGVEYKVNQNASAGTVSSSLVANITYATTPNGCTSGNAGCAPSVTSANSTGNDSDTVSADARLDVKATASQPSTAGTAITWTITANNGGGFAANDLASVKALLASANKGVLITTKTPNFGGSVLGLTATPGVTLNGATSGATATLYYTTDATGATGWTTTYNASAAMIGVFISGGAGAVELPSATGGSSGAGNVTTAQVTLTFTTNQPAGFGSGTTGSVTDIANGMIGGTPGATSVIPIVAPGVAGGTADSASASNLTGGSGPLQNTTSSSGTTPPGGASNTASSQAATSGSVVNGPFGQPGATGSYPAASNGGVAAATNNLDFTAVGFACSNGTSVNDGVFTCNVPVAGVQILNAIQNTGNVADSFTLGATAPAGYTVQLYNATSCPTLPYGGTSLPACTLGSQITGVSSAGGTVSGSVGSVASGAYFNYIAVYKAASAVTPFVAVDALLTATGTLGGAADTNNTHDDLYPGGAVKLTTSVSVTSTNCPSGASPAPPAGTVCPGGVLAYTVTYLNVAPAAVAPGGANAGTEPVWAVAGVTTGAGTLALTEDGNAAGNSWGTNTFGLNAAPSDSTGGTTYSYAPSSTFASGTYPSITAGPSSFVATVGGASFKLQPGTSGTITFNVTVK